MPWGIVHRAAPCRNAPVTFTLNRTMGIVVHQPRSWVTPVVLVLFLPAVVLASMPAGTATKGHLLMIGFFCFLLLASVWVQAVAGQRSVRVLRESGNVEVTWRTAAFRPRRAQFPLHMFSSVVSYNQPGRYPRTRVELVAASGAQALLVASYPAGSVAKSFWSLPRDAEADAARSARLSVARASGLVDAGVLGNRLPGVQLL